MGVTAGIATGYGLDDRRIGVLVSVGARIFTSPSREGWPIEYRGSFWEVKWQGRESDHSPPTSASLVYSIVTDDMGLSTDGS
jgi:hypothetical protein